MSDLNSEVIGGRSLRNRKSLAAKNKGKKLDEFRFRWLVEINVIEIGKAA